MRCGKAVDEVAGDGGQAMVGEGRAGGEPRGEPAIHGRHECVQQPHRLGQLGIRRRRFAAKGGQARVDGLGQVRQQCRGLVVGQILGPAFELTE